jgi:FkbM family methyltransferase
MSMVSYAQNFEDVLLWRALGHLESGFYIDVGAQDPVIDSVSKAFYEKGWRGIHIEASPVYASRIRQDRPDELVLQVALSDEQGVLTFYEIPETGLSTGEKAIAAHHASKGYVVRETVVPSLTLADVFAKVGDRQIHWLKIDVEGMEPKVLTGWGDSPARPWVVVVESTFPNSQVPTHGSWEYMLIARGYVQVYFDGLSRFYVCEGLEEVRAHFLSPPNIFDDFSFAISSPYGGPLSARLTLVERKLAAAARRRQKLVGRIKDGDKLVEQLTGEATAQRIEVRLARAERRHLLHERMDLRDELVASNRSAAQVAGEYADQLDAARRRECDLDALRTRTSAMLTDAQERLDAATQRERDLAMSLSVTREAAASYQRQLQTDHDERVEKLARAIVQMEKEAANERRVAQQVVSEERQHRATERAAAQHALSLADQEAETVRKALREVELELAQERDGSRQLLEQLQLDHAKERESAQRALREAELELSQEREGSRQLLQQLQLDRAKERESAQQTLTRTEKELARARELSQQMLRHARENHAEAWQEARQRFKQVREQLATECEGAIARLKAEVAKDIQSSEARRASATPVVRSLSELLRLNDQVFLECAYRTLLGRSIDAPGMDFYLARLRGGVHKEQIVAEMRLSPEGERRASTLSGLDALVRQHMHRQLPLIGRALRLLAWRTEHGEIVPETTVFDHAQALNETVDARLDDLQQGLVRSQSSLEETIEFLRAQGEMLETHLDEVAANGLAAPGAQAASGVQHRSEVYAEPAIAVSQILERIYGEIEAERAGTL